MHLNARDCYSHRPMHVCTLKWPTCVQNYVYLALRSVQKYRSATTCVACWISARGGFRSTL